MNERDDIGQSDDIEQSDDEVVMAGSAAPLRRRLFAEFVGTLIFVAVGTGAATVLALGPLRRIGGLAQILQGAPGQDQVFEAILANSLGDVLPVAFAFATILAVLVYAFGGVSGAHFNPAVSLSLAATGRFPLREVVPYTLVQCAGGIFGALIVAGIYGVDGLSLGGTDIMFGATTVQEGFDGWKAVLAEAFLGFVLMISIMAVAIDRRAPKGWSGLIIGLGFAGGILVTAAATGGSGNFARTLGPFVASLLYGLLRDNAQVNIPWGDLITYAVGPVLGATAAAFVYGSVTGLERSRPAPEPGAATGESTDSPEVPQGAGNGQVSEGQ